MKQDKASAVWKPKIIYDNWRDDERSHMSKRVNKMVINATIEMIYMKK